MRRSWRCDVRCRRRTTLLMVVVITSIIRPPINNLKQLRQGDVVERVSTENQVHWMAGYVVMAYLSQASNWPRDIAFGHGVF